MYLNDLNFSALNIVKKTTFADFYYSYYKPSGCVARSTAGEVGHPPLQRLSSAASDCSDDFLDDEAGIFILSLVVNNKILNL